MDLNKNQNIIDNNKEKQENVNINYQTSGNKIDNSSLSNDKNLKTTTEHQNEINISTIPNDKNLIEHKMISSNFVKLFFAIIILIIFIGTIYLLVVNKSENNFKLNKLSLQLYLKNAENVLTNYSIQSKFNITKTKKLSPIDESKNWQTHDFEEITFKLPGNWFTRKSIEPKYFNFDLQKPIINSSHSSESFAMYIENKKLEETIDEFRNCTKEEFPCFDLTSNEYIVDGKKITVLSLYHLSDDKKTKYYQFRGLIELNEGTYVFGGFSNPLTLTELEKYYFNVLSTFKFNE